VGHGPGQQLDVEEEAGAPPFHDGQPVHDVHRGHEHRQPEQEGGEKSDAQREAGDRQGERDYAEEQAEGHVGQLEEWSSHPPVQHVVSPIRWLVQSLG
jgi:hypothetical protein